MVTAQQVYRMLGSDSLWYMAAKCHSLLSAADISYSICRGVAVCLHPDREPTGLAPRWVVRRAGADRRS